MMVAARQSFPLSKPVQEFKDLQGTICARVIRFLTLLLPGDQPKVSHYAKVLGECGVAKP